MTVSREHSKHKLDLMGVHEVRWEGGGTEHAREYTGCIQYCTMH
jgi:hypothetical protein